MRGGIWGGGGWLTGEWYICSFDDDPTFWLTYRALLICYYSGDSYFNLSILISDCSYSHSFLIIHWPLPFIIHYWLILTWALLLSQTYGDDLVLPFDCVNWPLRTFVYYWYGISIPVFNPYILPTDYRKDTTGGGLYLKRRLLTVVTAVLLTTLVIPFDTLMVFILKLVVLMILFWWPFGEGVSDVFIRGKISQCQYSASDWYYWYSLKPVTERLLPTIPFTDSHSEARWYPTLTTWWPTFPYRYEGVQRWHSHCILTMLSPVECGGKELWHLFGDVDDLIHSVMILFYSLILFWFHSFIIGRWFYICSQFYWPREEARRIHLLLSGGWPVIPHCLRNSVEGGGIRCWSFYDLLLFWPYDTWCPLMCRPTHWSPNVFGNSNRWPD